MIRGTWGWWDNARCQGVEIMGAPFEEVRRKKELERARAVCVQCPVQQACLAEAMRLEVGERRHGFRGGLTPVERRRLGQAVSA